MAYRGTMKRRLERANKIGARAAIILGEDELGRGVAAVKDLAAGTQTEIALDALPAFLAP
jgi:histidyl-tRNA synthetase